MPTSRNRETSSPALDRGPGPPGPFFLKKVARPPRRNVCDLRQGVTGNGPATPTHGTATMNTTRVTRTIYISSGLLNGFYTLRSRTDGGGFSTDIYLRNLSTDQDKAEEKARDYFARVYGDTTLDVRFEG